VKGDWLVISILALAFALMGVLAGADWLLWLVHTVSRWLTAWPRPDEHFASMVGSLGWPFTVLVLVWLFRSPLQRAVYLLSERMKRDNLKIAGFIEVTRTDFNTMDKRAAVEHAQAAPAVAETVDIAESLLEYAGVSDENATKLRNWILENHPGANPEAFVTEPQFAEARHQAYIKLIEGPSDD
jgi:hypothetical protein